MAALAKAVSARNIRQESDMNRIAIAVVAAGLLIPAIHATDTPAALPPPTVKVGDIAPDFTLTDQKGNKVSLHDFKGKKNVALAFYIFAFTGG
jgi:cytochrome oxidase Cu insertion factor (SCO1/SenC/PrrC family)